MQYVERSLTDLAYSIEDIIEEIVFDHSIVSKAFNFVNGVLNEDPMSVMGDVSFTTEILDMLCGIQLNLQQALREIDLIMAEVKKICDEASIVNVDMQLGQGSAMADLSQYMTANKMDVFGMDYGFLSVLDRDIRVPCTLEMVQLKFLAPTATFDLPVSISKLGNLCTLIIHGPWIHREHWESPTLVLEYWNMPWLSYLHARVAYYLSNPLIAKNNLCTPWCPWYLERLSAITFSSCSEEVFSLMPFLHNLEICESQEDYITDVSSKWLSNLVHLEYLEALECSFYRQNGSPRNNLHWLLPSSLKKLTLRWSYASWRNMTHVAMLPNLEVLKLKNHAFQGQEWEPSKEGFRRLKYLLIEKNDLVHLKASSFDFPCLEHLALRWCEFLEKIPFGVAELPTLQLIELHYCSESAENSAEKIQEQIGRPYVDIRRGKHNRRLSLGHYLSLPV